MEMGIKKKSGGIKIIRDTEKMNQHGLNIMKMGIN